jgi:TolB-like protein
VTDRWARVESLCHAALARPAAERAAFLAEACGDDEALRHEVASLVAQAESSSHFLETPVGGAEDHAALVGRQLGAYRLDAYLGAGGMGAVYRAHDPRLGRDVAVKVLPRAWAADASRRARFEREARAVAALKHPHICTIHDVGDADGVDFLVMELIDGVTLGELIGRNGLKLNEALSYAVQIAGALAAAHDTGIVHRDLKPANIMVNQKGLVKVLDFGVAKLSKPGSASPASTGAPRSLTEEGAIVGTVAYMSPEQAEGRNVDARSDIFSFGSVLYEMVTGRSPFQGDTRISTLSAIVHQEPPPMGGGSTNVPPELERIIVRCLQKDPMRRIQHAGDVRLALEELKEESRSRPQAPMLGPARQWPSIAVLPFENMSGDPEQDYFADGIVEEIITALSRFRQLFVIARNSSFTYKGRAVDAKQIGRELGVRYVLEGSVRKAGNRVRITGQLVDAATGVHLWADRFDGGLEDIFDLQDQVTASVVGAIAPKLEQAEIERAKRKPTGSLDAYDCYLRGLAAVHQWTEVASNEALSHFYRAIELDPNFASAYGMAAECYDLRRASGWETDRTHAVAESSRLARRAAELGKDDAVALCTAGAALAYVVGDLDDGAAFIDQALVLNANLAFAWLFSGWIKVWLGEPEAAIERVTRAMRLSPQDPYIVDMQTAIANAHFFAGRYAEALSWAQTAVRGHPNFGAAMRILAASYAMTGRQEQAQKAMARYRELDPTCRISSLKDRAPVRRPEDVAKLTEGLRKAGLPE